MAALCLAVQPILPAWAGDNPSPDAKTSDPKANVTVLCDALTQLSQHAAQPFARRFAEFAPVIDRVFDVQAFLKASVGNARWSHMTPADQAQLLKVFRVFTVASYVANFNENNGETIKIEPEVRQNGADRLVDTVLMPPHGDTTPISYLLRDSGNGFKIVDVLINGGISQVAVQRSDFGATLSGTAGVAGLIATLQGKIKTLSGGTMNYTP